MLGELGVRGSGSVSRGGGGVLAALRTRSSSRSITRAILMARTSQHAYVFIFYSSGKSVQLNSNQLNVFNRRSPVENRVQTQYETVTKLHGDRALLCLGLFFSSVLSIATGFQYCSCCDATGNSAVTVTRHRLTQRTVAARLGPPPPPPPVLLLPSKALL